MTPNDMVYNETYKRCLKAGCSESLAKNTAVKTLQAFKNNQFSKPSKLITDAVIDAKKMIIKKRKGGK